MALAILWILLSAWLCACGWILSVLHALTGPGYLIALALTAGVVFAGRSHWEVPQAWRWPNGRRLWRRFQRPAPLIFLAIAGLGLGFGVFHCPENGDSNCYRIPRVLQWLAAGNWQWIHTSDARQNIAGCGYEWMFAPILLLTRSIHWIFLPNLIAYLLLPGMLFDFFRQLRIESRVAWWWSWLLATGWCYTMQACSTDTDSVATVHGLAALAFALRARAEQKVVYLWLSLLAAAVLTAVKPTNLPLLLPIFVSACPSWRLLLARPAMSTCVGGLATLASFVPLALLNWWHTGSWKGYLTPTGPVPWWHYGPTQELASPFWGVIGNVFCLTVQNLLPPFFPWAPAWNQAMHQFLQTPFGAHFASFEMFGRLSRSVNQGSAGIGLNIIIALAASFVFLCADHRSRWRLPSARPAVIHWIQWTPWLALVVFMAKVGSYQNARFLATYYPFLLLVLLLRPGMTVLVRTRWWRRLALLLMIFTLAFMGFELGRAFVPASFIARLHTVPHLHGLKVLDDYYQTRKTIADYRAFSARHAAGEAVVGYATICGGLEPGLWLPWGRGRVERVLLDDTPEWVRSRQIRRVFIDEIQLTEGHETLEQWLRRFHATLLDQTTYTTDPGTPPTHLYVAQLAPPDRPSPAQ